MNFLFNHFKGKDKEKQNGEDINKKERKGEPSLQAEPRDIKCNVSADVRRQRQHMPASTWNTWSQNKNDTTVHAVETNDITDFIDLDINQQFKDVDHKNECDDVKTNHDVDERTNVSNSRVSVVPGRHGRRHDVGLVDDITLKRDVNYPTQAPSHDVNNPWTKFSYNLTGTEPKQTYIPSPHQPRPPPQPPPHPHRANLSAVDDVDHERVTYMHNLQQQYRRRRLGVQPPSGANQQVNVGISGNPEHVGAKGGSNNQANQLHILPDSTRPQTNNINEQFDTTHGANNVNTASQFGHKSTPCNEISINNGSTEPIFQTGAIKNNVTHRNRSNRKVSPQNESEIPYQTHVVQTDPCFLPTENVQYYQQPSFGSQPVHNMVDVQPGVHKKNSGSQYSTLTVDEDRSVINHVPNPHGDPDFTTDNNGQSASQAMYNERKKNRTKHKSHRPLSHQSRGYANVPVVNDPYVIQLQEYQRRRMREILNENSRKVYSANAPSTHSNKHSQHAQQMYGQPYHGEYAAPGMTVDPQAYYTHYPQHAQPHYPQRAFEDPYETDGSNFNQYPTSRRPPLRREQVHYPMGHQNMMGAQLPGAADPFIVHAESEHRRQRETMIDTQSYVNHNRHGHYDNAHVYNQTGYIPTAEQIQHLGQIYPYAMPHQGAIHNPQVHCNCERHDHNAYDTDGSHRSARAFGLRHGKHTSRMQSEQSDGHITDSGLSDCSVRPGDFINRRRRNNRVQLRTNHVNIQPEFETFEDLQQQRENKRGKGSTGKRSWFFGPGFRFFGTKVESFTPQESKLTLRQRAKQRALMIKFCEYRRILPNIFNLCVLVTLVGLVILIRFSKCFICKHWFSLVNSYPGVTISITWTVHPSGNICFHLDFSLHAHWNSYHKLHMYSNFQTSKNLKYCTVLAYVLLELERLLVCIITFST